jgi:ferritin-like metal-binding protein YciE
MADSDLHDKLVEYIQDAHAMEQNVLLVLNSMIALTTDQEIAARLRQHYSETERHERLLRERLDAIGESPSRTTDTTAIMSVLMQGATDQTRSDKPAKNARDIFVTEHTEIAAYAILERLADQAADLETARLAREIRDDEERMAAWIASNWDRFVDLTLFEAGIHLVPVQA